MLALSALRETVTRLREQPVLFVPGLAYAVVIAPRSLAGQPGLPGANPIGLPFFLLSLLLTPFVAAGGFGMAAEALGGRTTLSTFRAVGRDRYLPLLAASLVKLVIDGVVAVSLVLIVFFSQVTVSIAFSSLAASSITAGLSGAGLDVFGLAIGVVGVVGLVVYVVLVAYGLVQLQFYGVAVAVDRCSPLAAFRRSLSLTGEHRRSAFAFAAGHVTLSVAATLPFVLAVLIAMMVGMVNWMPPGPDVQHPLQSIPTRVRVGFAAVDVLSTLVLVPIRLTYTTAFYRTLRPDSASEESSAE